MKTILKNITNDQKMALNSDEVYLYQKYKKLRPLFLYKTNYIIKQELKTDA